MAALYWRQLGRAREALRCVRASLFYSPPEHKDAALVSAANVLMRTGRYDGAWALAGDSGVVKEEREGGGGGGGGCALCLLC